MRKLEFKKELETALRISAWNPTKDDLLKIAMALYQQHGKVTKVDVENIIREVCGPFRQMLIEGSDNSDLTTLLVMATKVVEAND